MGLANVQIDSAASLTLVDACVIPVLLSAVTGTGGAVAHSNLQPYIVVFFFARTA